MQRQIVALSAVMLSLGMLSAPVMAQRMSPPAKASCQFSDGKTITVDYSSPRVRDRKIFGGLVPYGDVWILGANEATTFNTTADVTVAGKNVPAGKYALFAIPNPDSWTLIISTRTDLGRMSYYPGESSDFARVPMVSSKLPSKQEDFTISFVPSGSTCTMHVDWEMTRASIAIDEKK
jgi:Protein of unknown function (DUF2911)